MKTLSKAIALSLLLSGAVLAGAHAQQPQPTRADDPAQFHDGETQTVLDWQRLVDQANQYRYRKAAEEATRTVASQTPSR